LLLLLVDLFRLQYELSSSLSERNAQHNRANKHKCKYTPPTQSKKIGQRERRRQKRTQANYVSAPPGVSTTSKDKRARRRYGLETFQ
jgi:hypothetical protein